jgi:hypothetical protein
MAALVGGDALFQGGVVKPAAQQQDTLKCSLLFRSGLEVVFEGLAYNRLFHTHLFCLVDAEPASAGDLWLKPRSA